MKKYKIPYNYPIANIQPDPIPKECHAKCDLLNISCSDCIAEQYGDYCMAKQEYIQNIKRCPDINKIMNASDLKLKC